MSPNDITIEYVISVRDKLRQSKQFQLADEMRAKLDTLGITLEDTPRGTIWKTQREDRCLQKVKNSGDS